MLCAHVGFILDVYNPGLMFEITQPNRRMDDAHAIRVLPRPKRRKKRTRLLFSLALIVIYFFAPLRTNFLLLGTDDSPERGSVGRTDTIILISVVPLKPYIGILSIPRDLWVEIPGIGEQRINTAYFFAEANQAGTGGKAAMETIHENFDVPVRYYAVIHMLGLVSVIDALQGVDIELETSMGELSAGGHHLNGIQVLDFVRERSTSDDFGRMKRTQILLSATLLKMINPSGWQNLPRAVLALVQTVDTNLPLWQWPRLLFALLRALIFGVDSRVVSRQMVIPFQTSQGAQVLAPNWDVLRPVLSEMFGR